MKSLLLASLTLGTLLPLASIHAQGLPGSLDVQWDEGAEDCPAHARPPLQVHRYNASTFVLREGLCATAEAPFMYLLVGSHKAMLIDTGDIADPQQMPLAATVMGLLPNVGTAKMPLLVVHTHGHLDHRSGDAQFEHLPDVGIVATDLASVQAGLGLRNWPNDIAQVDLGDRIVDVIPTPGHYPSHVSFYDRQSALLFSGDFFMPGRLLIADATADLASAQRIADFVRERPLSHVLGGHIELDADGRTYALGATHHPREHALQLAKQDLLDLPVVVGSFNGFYGRKGMFVMANQNRVLMAIAALVIGGLVVVLWQVLKVLRRRRLGPSAARRGDARSPLAQSR
jgi:hydroxyacylglutathione hydrolase